MDAVSDILEARARRQQPLTPMVVVSAVAHVAGFLVLALMSLHAATAPPPKVFTISFAGSEGPRTGGVNPMGGRAVEQVAPPETKKNVEPPPPPSPKMVLPDPKPAKRRPETTVAKVETPTAKPVISGGQEIKSGSTTVDTPARGPGFGLSSGGGAGNGYKLDVSDFCCPEYVERMIASIKQTWKRDLGRPGTVVVKFTIRRDGSIDGATVEQSSGAPQLDFQAQRAVQLARLEQLPGKFKEETLGVHLTFIYER
jgi:TonB family protein